jgi:D-glycero-D-manno-heptose 1,7-bisphosphate phosphatase
LSFITLCATDYVSELQQSERREAVFLDRDGVLNWPVFYPQWGLDSPSHPGDLRLYDEVAEAISSIRGSGFLAVLVSNQPGMAKGKYSWSAFQRIDRKLTRLLAMNGTCLDGRYYCVHHPEASVARFRLVCDCRKPLPGLLLTAASELAIDLGNSYFIGDSDRDIRAGIAAGCQPIRIVRDVDYESKAVVPIVRDLLQATKYIEGRRGVHVA